MKFSKLFRIRKSRKYPIKRDGEGRSLRARCFGLFEQGKRPVEVTEELKMKETTVHRYFRDWKKLGPNCKRRYAYALSLFNKNSLDREKISSCLPELTGFQKSSSRLSCLNPMGCVV
jgi:hypothetical protein